MKVLIIDDNDIDLFLAQQFLNQEFELHCFNSLPAALEWAQNNDFDIAIIDNYISSDVWGTHVLRRLKAIKGDRFISVALSAHVTDDQTVELREAGFSSVMSKPLSLKKFKGCL